MGNLADYFDRITYKPTWFIGDRVFGRYKKIPFIGTVGNDTLINEEEGPRVTVHLDLPIRIDGYNYSFIIVKPKDLKRLISMDEEEPLKLRGAGSIPAKRTNSKNK